MIAKFAKELMAFASWKTVIFALVLAGATVGTLTGIATPRVVETTGGLEPFDVLWPLSATEIVDGLAVYNSEAQRAYLLFAAIDIPFPIFAGLFQVLLWSWLIKCSGFSSLIALAERGGVLFAFVPTLFDLAENVGFVVLVLNPPTEMTMLVQITSFFHSCKMQSIDVIFRSVDCW